MNTMRSGQDKIVACCLCAYTDASVFPWHDNSFVKSGDLELFNSMVCYRKFQRLVRKKNRRKNSPYQGEKYFKEVSFCVKPINFMGYQEEEKKEGRMKKHSQLPLTQRIIEESLLQNQVASSQFIFHSNRKWGKDDYVRAQCPVNFPPDHYAQSPSQRTWRNAIPDQRKHRCETASRGSYV